MDPSTVLFIAGLGAVYILWKSPSGYHWRSRTTYLPGSYAKPTMQTNYGIRPFDDWMDVHGSGRGTYLARLHSDFKRAGKDFEFHEIYGGDDTSAYEPLPVQGHRMERYLF